MTAAATAARPSSPRSLVAFASLFAFFSLFFVRDDDSIATAAALAFSPSAETSSSLLAARRLPLLRRHRTAPPSPPPSLPSRRRRRDRRRPFQTVVAAAAAAPTTSPVRLGGVGDDDDGADASPTDPASAPLSGLAAAVSGAGPSGLLLAHRLLRSGATKVSLFEGRSDPRSSSTASSSSSRAYALGLGRRGRTSVRSVDDDLWESVKERGYECDRFRLHLTPSINFRLRDGDRRRRRSRRRASSSSSTGRSVSGDDDDDDELSTEPSLLIYQTDLCAALLDELERRYGQGPRLELTFDSTVIGADVSTGLLDVRTATTTEDVRRRAVVGPYDLIVGCDGVNSAIRSSMLRSSSSSSPGGGKFESETRKLPGSFKVARISSIPHGLDPTSVALILPKRGRTTAFLEPTVDGGACVLFAGRSGGENGGDRAGNDATTAAAAGGEETRVSEDDDDDDDEKEDDVDWLLAEPDAAVVVDADVPTLSQDLLDRFPLLDGADLPDLVQQLLSRKPSFASSVKCNVYHLRRAALCGDAAHATGGVSGQGANSALVDAAVLSDCLEAHWDPSSSSSSDERSSSSSSAVEGALLAYSVLQVPEGHALYDLSFGPGGDVGFFVKARTVAGSVLDAIFGGKFGIGKPPLQTLLATSSTSFADIRRDRDSYYAERFPTAKEFEDRLSRICGKMEEEE